MTPLKHLKSSSVALHLLAASLFMLASTPDLPAVENIRLLPQDESGWTLLPLPEGSKTVFVSASQGDDANDGLSPERPVASLQKGFSLLDAGSGDHLLLRRGDVWEGEDFGELRISGKNFAERLVVSSYGEAPERPLLDTGTGSVFDLNGQVLSNVAIVGIDFYASGRDPDAPQFVGADAIGSNGAFRMVGAGENLLFEDCRFRFFGTGMAFDATNVGNGRFSNVVLRRNVFYRNYKPDSYILHESYTRSQGFYASEVDGLLMEENVFYHNGWNETVPLAGANMFNHNVYLQNTNSDVVHRGNINLLASAHGAQMRSGGYFDNNFYARNAISMNFGGRGYPTEYEEERNAFGIARDNVILQGRRMDPEDANWPRTGAVWAMHSGYFPAVAEGNIIANRLHNGNEQAFPRGDGGEWTLRDNIVYDWDPSRDMSNPGWIDPDRDVASYLAFLGEEGGEQAFLEKILAQAAGTWAWRLSAYALNAYVQAGFRVQNADYLRASHASLLVPADGLSTRVRIYHSGEVEVAESPVWAVWELSLDDEGTWLELDIQANTAETNRSDVIRLQDGMSQHEIDVFQGGDPFIPSLQFLQSGLALTVGQTATLEVESNVQWDILDMPDWLNVTPRSGEGDGSLTLSAGPNPSSRFRFGSLVLGNDMIQKSIDIVQQPDAETDTWAGYIIEDGFVNTHGFMGWLDVRQAPHIYSYSLDGWLFADEDQVTEQGAWIYFFNWDN